MIFGQRGIELLELWKLEVWACAVVFGLAEISFLRLHASDFLSFKFGACTVLGVAQMKFSRRK